jgi:hypothetical protein
MTDHILLRDVYKGNKNDLKDMLIELAEKNPEISVDVSVMLTELDKKKKTKQERDNTRERIKYFIKREMKFGNLESTREYMAERLLSLMSRVTMRVPIHGTIWQFFSNWLYQDPMAINIYENATITQKWEIFKYFERQLPIRVQAKLKSIRGNLDVPPRD